MVRVTCLGLAGVCLLADPGGWGWAVGLVSAWLVPVLLGRMERRMMAPLEAEWADILALRRERELLAEERAKGRPGGD